MYGAILGDIIGSPYEFDQGNKTKDFPLFTDLSMFTDDSIMTLAVAESLLESLEKSENISLLNGFALTPVSSSTSRKATDKKPFSPST